MIILFHVYASFKFYFKLSDCQIFVPARCKVSENFQFDNEGSKGHNKTFHNSILHRRWRLHAGIYRETIWRKRSCLQAYLHKHTAYVGSLQWHETLALYKS